MNESTETVEMMNEYEDITDIEGSTLVEVPSSDDHTQIFLVMPSEDKETVEASNPEVITNVEVNRISVSPSDANGLKSVVLSLIGDYETIVTDYTYSNGSYTQHSIDVQYDMPWLISAALFAICIWSCFKMWTIALRGNHRRRS